MRWKGGTYFLLGGLLLSILVCGGVILAAGVNLLNPTDSSGSTPSPVATSANGQVLVTNTARPQLTFATVTPAPPTEFPTEQPTETETPGPCTQQILPNDDLISILIRCGHRHYDTMLDQVLELNDLDAPEQIQAGQTILIPWPTPTPDPNAAPTEEAETSDSAANLQVAALESDDPGDSSLSAIRGGPTATATLQAGVTWHVIRQGEDIISIAINYGANLRILSELNPEVTFSQCDFGSLSGGPNCIVQLFEGQSIRVPAPTPTATVSVTPSGSETPTPSATATFNVPVADKPDNRAFFGKDDIVTLRWIATGTLGTGQSYQVEVEDQTSQQSYAALTKETFFIIPSEWQSQDGSRHDYVWTVSVIDLDQPDTPYFTTQPRMFTWQGIEGTAP